jgi:PAS domain-containing protein
VIVAHNARLTNKAAVRLGQTEAALNNSSELIRLWARAKKTIVNWRTRCRRSSGRRAPDGVFDYYNERWFDYTGMAPDKTESWGAGFAPDDLQTVSKSGTHRSRPAPNSPSKLASSELRTTRIAGIWDRLCRSATQENEIVKWFGTCTDIHEQKKIEDELRQIREELERRVEARTSELSYTAAALAEEIGERKNRPGKSARP